MSWLIFWTPHGNVRSAAITALPQASVSGILPAALASSSLETSKKPSIDILASVLWYSFVIISCCSFMISIKISSSPGASIRIALELLVIALSFNPPSTQITLKATFFFKAYNTLPRITFAFAPCFWISTPECPPVTPFTWTETTLPLQRLLSAGNTHSTIIPPAQPTRKCPSFSESRFSIRRDFKEEQSIATAPSIPISSSTVNTASIGGCSNVSSSRIASAIATAIPSSPPKVVPLA